MAYTLREDRFKTDYPWSLMGKRVCEQEAWLMQQPISTWEPFGLKQWQRENGIANWH